MDGDRIKDISLCEIENILRSNGRSLKDYPPMPLPNVALMINMANPLMCGVFFVNGFGGSGKTFFWNTLTSGLCSCGDIVLAGSEGHLVREFSDWILKIGNGDIGQEINDEESHITIPSDIMLTNFQDPIKAIVENTYPLFQKNFEKQDYIRDRTILAPTLDDEALINNYMLSLLPSEEVTYLSSDNICVQEKDSQLGDVYTTKFLNTISGSEFPHHQLKLKVGAPVMLPRNIENSMGLCNGTRLIVIRLCTHVIEALILSAKHAGEHVIIARMVIKPSDSRLSFKFQRRQFQIVLSFPMTINKSQGQTLSNSLEFVQGLD
ncbi:ATP-dependent DNA helicase PIF1-like [Senna tora]|uniref:ATP-dependent DNA helicase n=1 Tax=Senna tora TaxID=362788 RepID=A0A834X6D2_9FABA|nr:ATP-dependent DNA helicase PIF1-like [Senna tora]